MKFSNSNIEQSFQTADHKRDFLLRIFEKNGTSATFFQEFHLFIIEIILITLLDVQISTLSRTSTIIYTTSLLGCNKICLLMNFFN
ncbi:hypothetical protein T4B_15184 [Trichinella pseudospiralis]|uniref:Uncharacterized protein n=1 Tax=Trichinella pseudospiralis TaxID=6337 RepID=A0A0V1JI88_TRIPS|nr:hypothetical protein T4A_10722 [Trichinella pseudospiralis]KRZ34712.1 hypothetical protein T4B_15184 [Trichinella pseudospiralis]